MFSKKIICLGIYALQFVLFSSQAATVPAQGVEQWVPAQDEPFVAKRPQPLNRSLVAEAKMSEIKAEAVVKSSVLPVINTADSQLQYWSRRGRLDIVEHLRKRQDTAPAKESRLAQASVVAAGITQPVKTESTEPAKVEPYVAAQPMAEAAKLVSVNVVPVKSEPVKSEPVKAEPVRIELLKAEPVNTELLRTEAAKQVSVNAAPVKSEPVKLEPVKIEQLKAEPVKAEPVKIGPLKAEPAKPVSVNVAPIKAEPVKAAQVNPIEPVAVHLSNLPPRGEFKSSAYAGAQAGSAQIAQAIKGADKVPEIGPAAELIKVQPLTPTREEQARYWATRGRSDLVVVEPLARQSDARGAVRVVTVAKASSAPEGNNVSVVDVLPVVYKKNINNSNGYDNIETLESRVGPELNPDEQAKYWAARGRDDLAEQAKTKNEQSDTPFKGGAASRTSRTDVQVKNAAPGRLLTGDVSSDSDTTLPRLNPDEQAKYWSARGRDDLAEQAKARSEQSGMPVKGVEASRTTRAKQREEKVLVRGVERGASIAQPASQELNGGAEYWAARGRDDLADALKLRMAVARRDSVRVLPAAQTVTQDKSNQRENKSALEDALMKNPSGIKARLDLADIYRQTGELERASVLIDGVLAGNPDLAEALYARARLYAEQSLWREVLWVLEKVSPAARNGEMAKLQKTAWAHVQIDRADVLVRQGDHLEAQVLLRQVARELALNTTQRAQPESPSLWKNAVKTKGMR